MTLNRYEYFAFVCDGKLDNLVQPDCPATSAGGFTDTEAVQLQAKSEGWTFPGKRALCPACSAKAAPAEEKPARQPRAVKTAEQIEQTFPGGGAV